MFLSVSVNVDMGFLAAVSVWWIEIACALLGNCVRVSRVKKDVYIVYIIYMYLCFICKCESNSAKPFLSPSESELIDGHSAAKARRSHAHHYHPI